MYENEEKRGIFFYNNKKSDKQPDFRGDFKLNGVDYEIAGWKRTGGSGREFISLKIQEKEQEEEKRDSRPLEQKKEWVEKTHKQSKEESLDPQEGDLPF